MFSYLSSFASTINLFDELPKMMSLLILLTTQHLLHLLCLCMYVCTYAVMHVFAQGWSVHACDASIIIMQDIIKHHLFSRIHTIHACIMKSCIMHHAPQQSRASTAEHIFIYVGRNVEMMHDDVPYLLLSYSLQ